jgi:hypothetical protein
MRLNSLPPEGLERLMRELPYIARRALLRNVKVDKSSPCVAEGRKEQ